MVYLLTIPQIYLIEDGRFLYDPIILTFRQWRVFSHRKRPTILTDQPLLYHFDNHLAS